MLIQLPKRSKKKKVLVVLVGRVLNIIIWNNYVVECTQGSLWLLVCMHNVNTKQRAHQNDMIDEDTYVNHHHTSKHQFPTG